MTISVTCSECGASYDLPDSMQGQTGECECGATFLITLASKEEGASEEYSPDAVEHTSNNEATENAFAAPQVAEVSELESVKLSEMDMLGLRRFMTGLKLLVWIPGVAIIGVAVSFLIGMAIGGCDGLGAFIYLVMTTGVVTAFVAFLGYIYLAMLPSESGGRPYIHAAFWLPAIVLFNGLAWISHDLFGFDDEVALFFGGICAFAFCSGVGASGIIKMAKYLNSPSMQKSWETFRLTCLITSAVTLIPFVLNPNVDESVFGMVMTIGGIVVLISGWTLGFSTHRTIVEMLMGTQTVAAEAAQP